MKLVWLLSLVFSTQWVLASIHQGEIAPNLCWTNEEDKAFCLDEAKDKVRVLLYNGGFCGPCNTEFAELVPQVGKFNGKLVEFLSLSVAGWKSQSKPDATFLKEWKKKHKIPFRTLASSRKELGSFIQNPFIPAIVIIDKKGAVAMAEVNPGVDVAFAKIEELIQ